MHLAIFKYIHKIFKTVMDCPVIGPKMEGTNDLYLMSPNTSINHNYLLYLAHRFLVKLSVSFIVLLFSISVKFSTILARMCEQFLKFFLGLTSNKV